MGFLDKVKAQGTLLAEKAQQAGEAGQAKINETLSKRKADALLLELGGLYYFDQAGRTVAGSEQRIKELIEQLEAHESTNGPVLVTSANPAPATAADAPVAGAVPGAAPSAVPSAVPSAAPSAVPSAVPSAAPSAVPSAVPQASGVPQPSAPPLPSSAPPAV